MSNIFYINAKESKFATIFGRSTGQTGSDFGFSVWDGMVSQGWPVISANARIHGHRHRPRLRVQVGFPASGPESLFRVGEGLATA
ncbi:MAG: hypothetical protein WAL75_04590 [Terracidiphilus sp.]